MVTILCHYYYNKKAKLQLYWTALLSVCGERTGRIRISFLLNQEAVELEHPALRTSYLGWTPGTINHGQKESESMRKRIGQQRGRIKKVDKRVEGRKKQTSSGLIQQKACSGSTLSRIINRRWVTLEEVVKQWEMPSGILCCVAGSSEYLLYCCFSYSPIGCLVACLTLRTFFSLW